MKIGVVDVGGGYRGIYAAGVLDYCMDNDIRFNLGIGVSAGSANLISYAAGQPRRNYKFYTEYGLRKEYAGAKNFVTKKSFIDLDYAYSTLSNSTGEYPLDYSAVVDNPMEFYVVALNALTGETNYFDKRDIKQDNYDALKASCAIPFVCKPIDVCGIPYFDGGLADPVPIKKAFELGCDKVVVLLTRPADDVAPFVNDVRIANLINHSYPAAATELRKKADKYREGVMLAKKYEKEGKALIVAPEDTCGVRTLTREKAPLTDLYNLGYGDGKRIYDFVKENRNVC